MTDTNSIKTYRQTMSLAAYAKVEDAKGAYFKQYMAYYRRLPSMIKTSGLSATVAFIRAKMNGSSTLAQAYKQIYKDLEDWFFGPSLVITKKNSENNLIRYILEASPEEYRAITNETLTFMSWMKRFCEGRPN